MTEHEALIQLADVIWMAWLLEGESFYQAQTAVLFLRDHPDVAAAVGLGVNS